MFKSGSVVYLSIPSNSQALRALYRGAVVEFSSGGITIAMDEQNTPFQPEQDVFFYYDRQRSFMQQAARVEATFQEPVDGEPSSDETSAPNAGGRADGVKNNSRAINTIPMVRTIVGIQVVGEPVSAETRGTYRVTTSVTGGVTATIDQKVECIVLDVSATGFSVICDATFRVGQTARVVMHHEQCDHAGNAIVQGVKELSNGQRRYGFQCGEARSNAALHRGLQKISAAIQRQQLRRTSGAGAP